MRILRGFVSGGTATSPPKMHDPLCSQGSVCRKQRSDAVAAAAAVDRRLVACAAITAADAASVIVDGVVSRRGFFRLNSSLTTSGRLSSGSHVSSSAE